MRLFHVSEEAGIRVFEPRVPSRADVERVGLVWAVDEWRLPNYLLPRDCPRVTYHAHAGLADGDEALRFFSSSFRHVVAIEHGWFKAVCDCRLYVYEFDPAGFELQDAIAGYYVSKTAQVPISVTKIDDAFTALFKRGVEVRLVDNLWDLADAVQASSFNWSLIRMANAAKR
ncbi:MAG: hypothetical protein FWB74_04605 [Defluviitaleaceae bacterium]|nr:hypothetical protein [Defluviitaleaceae bacterium]